jgi:hypothetical protein
MGVLATPGAGTAGEFTDGEVGVLVPGVVAAAPGADPPPRDPPPGLLVACAKAKLVPAIRKSRISETRM